MLRSSQSGTACAELSINRRNQNQVNRGVRAGISTAESAEWLAAHKRIRALETELTVTRWANELLKAKSDPEGAGMSSRRS